MSCKFVGPMLCPICIRICSLVHESRGANSSLLLATNSQCGHRHSSAGADDQNNTIQTTAMRCRSLFFRRKPLLRNISQIDYCDTNRTSIFQEVMSVWNIGKCYSLYSVQCISVCVCSILYVYLYLYLDL